MLTGAGAKASVCRRGGKEHWDADGRRWTHAGIGRHGRVREGRRRGAQSGRTTWRRWGEQLVVEDRRERGAGGGQGQAFYDRGAALSRAAPRRRGDCPSETRGCGAAARGGDWPAPAGWSRAGRPSRPELPAAGRRRPPGTGAADVTRRRSLTHRVSRPPHAASTVRLSAARARMGRARRAASCCCAARRAVPGPRHRRPVLPASWACPAKPACGASRPARALVAAAVLPHSPPPPAPGTPDGRVPGTTLDSQPRRHGCPLDTMHRGYPRLTLVCHLCGHPMWTFPPAIAGHADWPTA